MYLQGFQFLFDSHPDPDQRFVSTAFDHTGHISLDEPSIIDSLFKDTTTKATLVDNAPSTLQDAYINSFLTIHPAVNAANKTKSEDVLKQM